MDRETYDFDVDFQRAIIKLSVSNNGEWYVRNRHFIVPSYMDTSELELIATGIEEFYDKNDCTPELDVLRRLMADKFKDTELHDSVLAEIEKIAKMEVTTSKAVYVTDAIRKFATHQTYRTAILDAAAKLETFDHDGIREVFDRAVAFGEGTERKVISFFDEIEVARRSDRTEIDQNTKIPTLYRTVDSKMRGGPSRKELALFLAAPYVGKSAGLVNIGANAVIGGKRVLHVTVEMSAEKTAFRYDSRLSGMPYDDIEKDPDKYRAKLKAVRSMHKGDLLIIEYPSRTATVADIKAEMKTLARRKGFIPDVLIVDYADELKRTAKKELETYAIGEVIAGLRALATELNIVVWSATQAKRSAMTKSVLTLDDVADSWEKAKIADIIIAMCQTEKEQNENRMRWVLLKNRDNQRFSMPILMKTKFEKMHISEG